MTVEAIQETIEARQPARPMRSGLLAWWHLLSLDAPCVAALWTWFVARAAHVALPPALPAAMFVAVWLLYATDRLLDSATSHADLEERHRFHDRHRRAFVAAISTGSAALLSLILVLPRTLIAEYMALAALLALWFALIHVHPRARAQRLPKEMLVGVFFSAAVFLPVWLGDRPEHGWLAAAALSFGLLCALNCLCIFAWEHDAAEVDNAHATTRLGMRNLHRLGAIAIASAAVAALLSRGPAAPVSAAVALSAVLLLLLHRLRHRLDATTLRAAADLVLLTPLLVVICAR